MSFDVKLDEFRTISVINRSHNNTTIPGKTTVCYNCMRLTIESAIAGWQNHNLSRAL